MKKTHCCRGHRFYGKNIRWVKVRGRWYRSCRLCVAERNRKRYHNNEAFREQKRQASLAYYHRNKNTLNAC